MPIKIFDTDGFTKLFDTDEILNGVCLGVINVPAGTSYQKQFDLLAGAQVRVVTPNGSSVSGVTIDYPGSVPRVTFSAVGWDRDVVLWATGSPTILNSAAGVQAVSIYNTVALSTAARGMNYRGKGVHVDTTVSLGAKVNQTYNFENKLGSVTLRFYAPSRPLLIARVVENQYVRQLLPVVDVGGGAWDAKFQCVDSTAPNETAAWPTLLVPDVYAFASSVVPTTSPEFSIRDLDGSIAYDLTAGRLLSTSGGLTYAGGSSTPDSYQLPLPSGVPTNQVGVLGMPYYSATRSDPPGQAGNPSVSYSRNSYYSAFWTLAGSNLNRQRILTTRVWNSPIGIGSYQEDATPEVINLTGY